jgi:hypothetical protein
MVITGTAASSPIDPALPVGASYLVLDRVTVAPGNVLTITRIAKPAKLVGGANPVLSTDTDAPLYDGQVRVHPTYGVQVGTVAGGWPLDYQWQAPALAAAFAEYTTGGYPPFGYRLEGKRIFFRGMLQVATGGSGAGAAVLTAALPTWARPAHLQSFYAMQAGATPTVWPRFSIDTAGTMLATYALPAGTFVLMHGVNYALG